MKGGRWAERSPAARIDLKLEWAVLSGNEPNHVLGKQGSKRPSGPRIHAHSAAGGNCYHRDSGGVAATGIISRQIEGSTDQLHQQPQAANSRCPDVQRRYESLGRAAGPQSWVQPRGLDVDPDDLLRKGR